MVITHHGGEFFKIVFGDTILALNPISKESSLKGVKFGADIALITISHPDMHGVDQVTHGDRIPFVISGPGAYEVNKIIVRGFQTSSHYGGTKRLNTIYTIMLEGMTLCFLGALDDKSLSSDLNAELPGIDILFVPIGGDGVLNPADAHTLAVELEPSLVIPMHFEGMGEKDALSRFLKQEGGNGKPVDKLTIKKKDLEDKDGEVVVLKP